MEHQFGHDWLTRASYVGTKGTHLWGDYDANAPIYNPALTLAANRQAVESAVYRNHGTVIKTIGDAYLVVFESATDASRLGFAGSLMSSSTP